MSGNIVKLSRARSILQNDRKPHYQWMSVTANGASISLPNDITSVWIFLFLSLSLLYHIQYCGIVWCISDIEIPKRVLSKIDMKDSSFKLPSHFIDGSPHPTFTSYNRSTFRMMAINVLSPKLEDNKQTSTCHFLTWITWTSQFEQVYCRKRFQFFTVSKSCVQFFKNNGRLISYMIHINYIHIHAHIYVYIML